MLFEVVKKDYGPIERVEIGLGKGARQGRRALGWAKKPKPAWFAPYGLRRCRHIRERWPKAQAAERLLTPRAIILRPIGAVKPWLDLIPVIHTGGRSERCDEKNGEAA